MPNSVRAAGRLLSTALDEERSRRTAWRFALAVMVTGTLVTLAVSLLVSAREQTESQQAVAEHGARLAGEVLEAVDEVVERLVAVGGLYQGSEEVTREEFRRFVSSFDPIPGMEGLGYLSLLTSDELDAFEDEMSRSFPGFFVFELDEEGNRVPAREREWHAVVQWFEPEEGFGRPHGFDSASTPERRSALEQARDTGAAAVTPFLRLISETDDDGFLVYWPVTDPDQGRLIGFTLAPMDLSELLDGQVDPSLTGQMEWSIAQTDSSVTSGSVGETEWRTSLLVGGQIWVLTVSALPESSLAPDAGETAAVAIPGMITTILATAGAYLYRRKTETQTELEQVRQLARAKDQFLATVSHELRTPLTGVLGFAEILRDANGDLTEGERRSIINSVANEAADLSAIIEDLLVAARSELDLLVLTQVPVSLRAQVAQVLETVHGSPGQAIRFVGDTEGGVVAAGDPGRVRQVLRNLISNASRYGGGNLEVRFGGDQQRVWVEVADDGPGISEEECELIFEPYYRAHESTTQPAALGIGLSVARQLARLMGGDLTYRRERGMSVFRLELPAMVTEASSLVSARSFSA